jgi:ketose-bisphosphate aldolase
MPIEKEYDNMDPKLIIDNAYRQHTVVPAFNVPNLNMVEPIIQAVVDENSIAMIQVARLEWEKMDAKSLEDVARMYYKFVNSDHVMLHLDHVPVIDEDKLEVDYLAIIRRAIEAGYQSVMVDGSRLSLVNNIEATSKAVALAHSLGVPCEAELGAVMGHEASGLPDYEELFRSKTGFTDPSDLSRFVKESSCDWVSVAAGSFHGAIAESNRYEKKPQARLDIEHLQVLNESSNIPLVLHGGSGIPREFIKAGIKCGISKINVGSELRRAFQIAYEKHGSISRAANSLYTFTREFIRVELETTNSKDIIG